ncbi:MAG: FAD-dependent oxidoreductase [Gammaproteobacteria bacterium]|nr:FAD-dependent oxidoreductase [Gammaproteobacteria bacterium]MCY4210301.1 FAD-dependent oxidoreductase [Gammaproteobacteria bacterium]
MAKHGNIGKARQTSRQARRVYEFVRPAEIDSGEITHFPVVIAGGGPIGLASAIDLARYGVPAVVLEKHNSVGDGSRAICWAKRTLEILDRIGVSSRMMEKGVVWNQGWVYFGEDTEPIYKFDLLPDKQQKFPAFINLQQFYAEEYLIDLFPQYPQTGIRWQNEVVGVDNGADKVVVTVRTPVGEYQLSCDYLIAADGHRSPIRDALGLDFVGRTFEDNFLIADVRMKADFPAIRRFWFDPPFNPGQTSLIHKQADDVWRIDFQMGWDIDREEVMKEANIDAKIRAFLGADIEFDYEWVSLYTFKCCRMEKFVHGRTLFAGDSAHLVSPFGARGANGGLQDVDNLVWKLHLVLRGAAPPELIRSYDHERLLGAEENVVNSSRSTDFMTPKSAVSLAFRNATLELAKDFEFARRLVNPGRLSAPSVLDGSPLNTPDEDEFSDRQRPGAPCLDAPVTINGAAAWFLNQLGERFVGVYFRAEGSIPAGLDEVGTESIPVATLVVSVTATGPGLITDTSGLLHRHYDARPGTYYLVRPDQHIAGRWREFNRDKAATALARATGRAG